MDVFHWNGSKDEKGRRLLQLIGTEVARECIDEDFWVNEWVNTCEKEGIFSNYDYIIIDDMRFDNEAKMVREYNGVVVMVEGEKYNLGSNSTHASERGVDISLVDYYYKNTKGSLEEENNHITNFCTFALKWG